jgi:hypothetical protein
MPNVGVTYNNPGNLTVGGPSSFLYGGQTGVYSSPNGLYYAEFGSPQAGYNALTNYISTHVANGWTTLSQFVNNFVNGPNSSGAWLNTASGQNYVAAVSNARGVSPNGSLVGVDPNLIAKGISQGEGTSSLLAGISGITASGLTTAAQNGLGGSASGSASSSSNPSLGFLGGLLDVEQFFLRFGLVIIGGIIVIVALWQLLADHTDIPSPADAAGAAKDAGIAALAA